EVGDGGVVFDGSDVGLEHEVAGPGGGEAVFGAAVGAGARGWEVVGAEALLAVAAVDEGVGEGGDVAAGFPDLGGHEDGGVEADDVVALLDHGAPPGVLDVAFEEDADGPVVPGGAEPAVDLAGGE